MTWENIGHISAKKVVEVLERNFGGGWDSLPQSVQDIINSSFDVSTTTLPVDRLKKPGGLYQKKVEDGYEVLEVAKGTWVEAIFVKEKQNIKLSKGKFKLDDDFDEESLEEENYNLDLGEDDKLIEKQKVGEDEDDGFDDDKLTEESYRTTFDESAEDLDLRAEDVSVDEDF